jgi:predicted nucleic acid-binding Zn ribbon protein
MSFRSLHQVLGFLESQASWKGRRQFQQLLACWAELVGPAVAAQTRPVGIQRRVLQVATSSSVWAQNLAFERFRILEKLNARLPLGLTDIRFSSAQWQADYGNAVSTTASDAIGMWRDHPSRLADAPMAHPSTPETIDPHTAFRNWARRMRARSQHLPLCPACHSPTPVGELERWSVCSLCAAQQFGDYHPPLPPPSNPE